MWTTHWNFTLKPAVWEMEMQAYGISLEGVEGEADECDEERAPPGVQTVHEEGSHLLLIFLRRGPGQFR